MGVQRLEDNEHAREQETESKGSPWRTAVPFMPGKDDNLEGNAHKKSDDIGSGFHDG